jgi:N-acetylneuraminic acid mutarotase
MVLVAGGLGIGIFVATAELYDSASGTWTETGNLNHARISHTATLLPNGMVLVAAGEGVSGGAIKGAELYDPASGTWTDTGSLRRNRVAHTATLLQNGRVLVAGGISSSGSINASAELYDSASGTWTATGSLVTAREAHTATLLSNGKVLVAGGAGNGDFRGVLASAELYDLATGAWVAAGSHLINARLYHTATLLPDGNVLFAAGGDASTQPFRSAELGAPR